MTYIIVAAHTGSQSMKILGTGYEDAHAAARAIPQFRNQPGYADAPILYGEQVFVSDPGNLDCTDNDAQSMLLAKIAVAGGMPLRMVGTEMMVMVPGDIKAFLNVIRLTTVYTTRLEKRETRLERKRRLAASH